MSPQFSGVQLLQANVGLATVATGEGYLHRFDEDRIIPAVVALRCVLEAR